MRLRQLSEKVIEGEFEVSSLAEDCLKKIGRDDLNLFITIDKAYVEKQLEALRKRIDSGDKNLPLAGIPIAAKDNLCTKGVTTTCGSKILDGYIPPYDATVIAKLKEAGAVIIGKTNMDEFAMGSSTEHSAFGPTKNPHNAEYIPGGSSGGSSAAVAANICPASLGSDTGGSIRQPASLCGVVGIKPTYGRVSRYGLIAFASSLDQIGPITQNVEDAAYLLNIIAGFDSHDSTSLNVKTPDFTDGLDGGVKGLKIGIPKEYFVAGTDKAVLDAVRCAAETLENEGAKLVDISLPLTEYAIPTYYIIAPAEASANLARYDGIRYGFSTKGAKDLNDLYKKNRSLGFGPEVTLRIIIGTYVLSSGYYDEYYRRARKVRKLIIDDFNKAFTKVDVVLTPTSPTTAFKLGERLNDPIKMYLSDIFTAPANLAKLPAISVPCGLDSKRLPIGLQLIGRPLDEGTIFKAAYCYERLRDNNRA